jgi:TPR repeat protein
LFKFFRLLAKFGIGKEFYRELEISRDLGICSRAYKRKNYEECLEIYNRYKDCVSDRCSGIKYTMALMHYYGHGVTLNRKKSIELFEECAALGDIDAKLFLRQFEVRTHEKT